jgi:8-oxo-dGTP pyrophosphatase MutT (NUDIX family)
MSHEGGTRRKQVAAIPVMRDEDGVIRVCLITTRGAKRLIVPKGRRKAGVDDRRMAAIEAEEEIGLRGRIRRKPLGRYRYWKRVGDHFELCKVKVFLMTVRSHALDWKEKGQRRGAWLPLREALAVVDEPLVPLLRALPARLGGS